MHGTRNTTGDGRPLLSLGELTLHYVAAVRICLRRHTYRRELLEQSRHMLTASFVPLLLAGLGFGAIVSLEAGHLLRAAGAGYRLGSFTAISNIRVFSPVATGLLMAVVSGTSVVADLGTRQVRSELEAFDVTALSRVLCIVVPRAHALMLVTALSNFLMIVITTLASYFAGVVVVGVEPGRFVAGFFMRGTLVDVVGSEIKTLAFGAIVAAVCIERGLSARGGAEGVARAVRSSVLWSFLAITVLDYLFTPTMLALFHDQLML